MKCYPIHLPGENYVSFEEDQKDLANDTISPLERYFARPKDQIFDDLLYSSYYEDFMVSKDPPKSNAIVWHDCVKKPKQYCVFRRTKKHIARLVHIRPQAGESWYLRLLLQNCSARSYDDLLWVRGQTNLIKSVPLTTYHCSTPKSLTNLQLTSTE